MAHAYLNVDSFSGPANGGGASFFDKDGGICLTRLSGVLGDGMGEIFVDDVAASAIAFPAAS